MTDIQAIQMAEGRLVRDPQTKRPIKPGKKVDLDDPFWYRRWKSGDIVKFTAPAEKQASGEPSSDTADTPTSPLAAPASPPPPASPPSAPSKNSKPADAAPAAGGQE